MVIIVNIPGADIHGISLINKKGDDFFMKKIFVLGLFLVLVVAAFTGTALAAPTIETTYMDEDGFDITTAEVGDDVEYFAGVYGDGVEPASELTVEMTVTSDVDWDFDSYYVSWDGGTSWVEDDPSVTVTRTDDEGWGDSAIWHINNLAADQAVMFNVHGTVLSTGFETTLADLVGPNQQRYGRSVATLNVNEPEPKPEPKNASASSNTVGMQETGSPLGFAGLAIALLSAGLIYARKQQ